MAPTASSWRYVHGVLFCLGWPVCVMARPLPPDSLADLSLEELSNIEITSVAKRTQALSDAATSVFVITADDIRRSGANSLPEVLRLAPNLHVAQVSTNGYSVSARGFSGTSANKLLVLIDGRSVYTPLFAGVFWDVQDVVLQDVERIEVISGPGGTLWGVNAVNGVINVITRNAADTQGTLAVASAGRDGGDIALRHGLALGANGHLRLHARHLDRRPTSLANGREIDDAWQLSQAGFRADWAGARDDVMVQGQVYEGDHGQPPPGSIAISGVSFALGTIDTRGANLLARWKHRQGDGGELQVQGYLDHTERIVPPTFSEDLDITDLQVQYALPATDRHALILGGQYRHSRDRLRNSVYFGFLPAALNQTWASLFAQDDIRLGDTLRLTLGARLERNDYTGNEFLPNARLAWKLAPNHLLWAAASRTVRAPSRLDRDPFIPWPASRGPGPAYLLAGGPGVPSEVARVYELGWRGQPVARTSVSVTAYRAFYEHLHTQELAPTRTHLIFAGRMQAAISGLEMWGSFQPLPIWRLSAGFSGLYQRFWLAPDSTDRAGLLSARGKDPARTWHLRSSWDLPGQQALDMMVRHVSALRTPAVPSYTAVDLRWGWHTRPGLELSITGRNLFDPGHGEYTAITTRSELGRSVHVQAIVHF